MNPASVAPMPEELAIAHRERIALFYGVDGNTDLGRRLLKKVGSEGEGAAGLSPLNRLANVLGGSMADYARQHSMLGVLRVAARPADRALHGAIEGTYFSNHFGMRTPKTYGYLCTKCIEEDLNHWKFSWYRRAHQLQGVDWCSSHRVPLFRISSPHPWSRLPHHWVETDELVPVRVENPELPSDSFESRLMEISCALLQRPRPFDAGLLTNLLATRAREMGLLSIASKINPTLSSLVRRIAPAQWIERYWPGLLEQELGSSSITLNTTLSTPTQPSTGFAYITAFVTLWDSPIRIHHALQQIENTAANSQVAEGTTKTHKEKRGKVSRMTEFGSRQ